MSEAMPIQSFSELACSGLGEKAAQLYHDQGIILVRQLINPEDINHIRKEFTEHVESHEKIVWTVDGRQVDAHIPEGDILKRYPRYSMPHRFNDMAPGRTARSMITDSRIFNIAENLIGPTYAAQSMFYFKPPTARGQAMHQDNFFLQSHPETCLAAWIAIDDADAGNGALKVVPGSHVYDIACPEDADPSLSFSKQGVRLPKDAKPIQSELKAGDVLFFHGSLIHGSLPNSSTDRFRRALIFHYIPQDSREVARFYQPLLSRNGKEVRIAESIMGGECGTAWETGEA